MRSLFADDRFRIVPETMVDGLIVIDSRGDIRYVNPACLKLFEYASEADMIGRNVSMLMPPVVATRHDSYLTRARETKVKRIIGIGRELQGLKATGAIFPMYLSVGEAMAGEEIIFVGIIYDLTDKKRAEEVILHHQKLDAIGQLSGGIAHDFNNILSIIGGNLEIVEQLDLPPAARRAIARAQEATTRAARITARLLAFARRQPLTRQPTNLNLALQGMEDMLHRALGETVSVRLHLATNLEIVDTDIDQFETAILNLAVNARDAMPKGGVLTIETEPMTFDDTPRTRHEIPPGRYVRVSVSDNGEGMPPDVLARAMEPFFTTKEVGAGTGLGLSMVYGLMKQIGGHARIYSEPGKGTRVSLFFPVSDRASAPAPSEFSGAATPEGAGELILVVEDDPDVRHVTVSRLQSLNYQVKTAADGASALRVIASTPDIHLALLDIVMPGGMDGHALADEIEKVAPQVKLVLTSGYSPRMATGQAESTRPFLPKPSTRAQLAQTIRSALDS